jgi:ribonuclease R
MDKIEVFRSFIAHLGYTMRQTKNARELSGEINNLLSSAKGKPEEGAIEIMALRSMARARYSTDNMGHYGLAFDYYTHFTSPIRRYPDMMVHRMLAHYLDKGKSLDKKSYEEKCVHSSEREQLATEAERSSIKYKMVEFMQDKVGMEFNGNVSGVTEWGIFVELEGTKVEGLVALRDIKDDYFVYDQDTMSLKGRETGRVFVLGTPVKVKVVKANLEQKQLDYALVQEEGVDQEPSGNKGKGKGRGRTNQNNRGKGKTSSKAPKKARNKK